jgi:hypothetical protein
MTENERVAARRARRSLAVRFEEDAEERGVARIWARNDFVSSILDLERGGAPALVRVAGRVYLAEEVLRTVGGCADVFPAELRYGPGARRRYVRLTEAVVLAIGREGELGLAGYSGRAPTERMKAKGEEAIALSLALIDLLPRAS